MSGADVLTGATAGPTIEGTASVPFHRLVRVELRKTVDTRAGRWLLISIALVTVAAMVLFLIFAPDRELTFYNFIGITATPQGFLLPVLGILSVTSEWSQRTGLVTFTLEPRRGRALAAKVAAVVVLGLLFVVLLLASAAVGNILGEALRGGVGEWGFDAGRPRQGPAAAADGPARRAGVRHRPAQQRGRDRAVVRAAAGGRDHLRDHAGAADSAPWIDIRTAQAALFDFENPVTTEEWMQVLVTSLWWIWLPLAGGVIRVLRSEVKSA